MCNFHVDSRSNQAPSRGECIFHVLDIFDVRDSVTKLLINLSKRGPSNSALAVRKVHKKRAILLPHERSFQVRSYDLQKENKQQNL